MRKKKQINDLALNLELNKRLSDYERDLVLVLLNERTIHIEKHLVTLNDHVAKNQKDIADNKTNIALNTSNVKRVWWLVGGVGLVIITALLSWALGLI